MNKCKLVYFLIIIVIIKSNLVDCAKKKSTNRYRGKKAKANCHLKELDKCVKSLDKYKNDTNAYKLITTERGLDEICSNSLESFNCLSEHITKCGTPLQKDMFDFATEQFSKSIDKFCKPGDLRNEFLKHSSCIAENVLNTESFQKKCNKPWLASVEKLNDTKTFDDRLDLACCAYNRWESCALNITEKACKASGRKNLDNFLDKAFAGFSNLVCKSDDFLFTQNRCVQILPTNVTLKGTAKDTKNPITKYLTSYFGFLVKY